jgi:hypothetical protein
VEDSGPVASPNLALADHTAYSMRAMGRSELPTTFELLDRRYRLVRIVKHDFFAATGFYANSARIDDSPEVVLKVSRTADFAGVPLEWLGRWLCRRELHFYGRLSDLPNVPRVLGTVGRTGFVHEFVPGRPLSKDRPVPDRFFAQLHELMLELHRRRIAYVDTNKPENILLGDDGRPHLIDFQISWDLSGPLGDTPWNRWWLRHLQRSDLYHVFKHMRRLRRDEMTDKELERSQHRGPLIRAHRLIFKPYFLFRRHTFRRLRETGRLLPEGSK